MSEQPERQFAFYDPKTGEILFTLIPDPEEFSYGKTFDSIFENKNGIENVEFSVPEDFNPQKHKLFVDVETKSIKTKERGG